MSTNSERRCALYLRQSLNRAEGIASQRTRCTALATARAWPIVEVFEDNETKASEERGEGTAWDRMLPRVGKDFDVIVAVDLDRLARNTRDLNKLIDLGGAVVTVDGEIDLASAEGEFRGTMITAIARFETRRASERQQRHKAEKAKRGEWHGGIPPYGYKLDKIAKTLVPEPSEVARIKEVASRLLNMREPMNSIVKDWNDQGIQTRKGNHWRQANLRSIMLNRAMLGETKIGAKAKWEPIIDAETFDRVTALLTDPSRKVIHSPGVKGGKNSLGGGLAVCGNCGKPLVTNSRTGTDRGRAIACLSRVSGPSDKHPRESRTVTRNGEKVTVMQDTGRVSISHSTLEAYVFEQAIARLNDTERMQKRLAERDPQAKDKIATLNARRDAAFSRKSRAEDLALDGLIGKDKLRETIASANAEIEQIARDIDKLVGPPDIAAALGDRAKKLDGWRDWTPGQRRAFLKLLMKRVVVNEWPSDLPRVRPRRRGETDESYKARIAELQREALERRVEIDWRE